MANQRRIAVDTGSEDAPDRSFSTERPYFFEDGIRFECKRCGACCTGEPGTIYVAADEIEAIAAYLEISADILKTRYGYPFLDSISFREEADGRCCFYDEGCLIYPVRPRQCRTYPFWFDIMRSQRRWQQAVRECPGIGEGRRFSREEILANIAASFPAPLKEGSNGSTRNDVIQVAQRK